MIENRYARCWMDEEILIIEYAIGLEVDLAMAIEIIKLKIEMTKNQALPLLVLLNNVRSINKEAREYLANVGTNKITATAILSDSPVSKILGNFYISLSKPPIPTRLFTNIPEAKIWLASIHAK